MPLLREVKQFRGAYVSRAKNEASVTQAYQRARLWSTVTCFTGEIQMMYNPGTAA